MEPNKLKIRFIDDEEPKIKRRGPGRPRKIDPLNPIKNFNPEERQKYKKPGIDRYEGKRDEFNLLPRRRIFAMEYCKDYNGTRAARRAGYSESSAACQAHQLLKDPDVIAFIEMREKDLATRFQFDKERVLKEMSLLAFSDIKDYGKALQIDGILDKLPPQASRAVKEFKIYKKYNKDGVIESETIDFKLHDKKAALDQMGKELGLFKERTEITGPDGQPLGAIPTTIVFDFGEEKKDENTIEDNQA